jgi:hypothetical protein
MADNPFHPAHFGLLAALGAELDSKPNVDLGLLGGAAQDFFSPLRPTSVAGLFQSSEPVVNPYANTLVGAATDLFSTPPLFSASTQSSPFGSFAGLMAPPAPSPYKPVYSPQPRPKPIGPETKRKAFFSFHYDDIMRVNNVRNAWKISNSDSSSNRSFFDSSLWETRKVVRPEVIKQLIRTGVSYTSAVCVLAGSMTWDRRWVKYEIARAIVDGRGLLTVHLNGINHHQTKGPHPRGLNPLAHMGVAKLQPSKHLPPQYHLYEMKLVPDGCGGVLEQWSRYNDYAAPVKKPAWLTDTSVDYVMPLSVDAAEYDYELEHGNRNIGSWIDKAAKQAGR